MEWGDDLAVYNYSILMELDVYLVTIDINRLDGQLIALFHGQRRAGGDSFLIIIIHQDLEKLLIGKNILVIGLLEEDIIGSYPGCQGIRRSTSRP